MKKEDKKIPEISDEAFLLALIDSFSTTPEQVIVEMKAIIADEMKNPVLKRDYKTILDCRYDIRKCKKEIKKRSREDEASTARILKKLVNYYDKTVNNKF